jgi:hypothetical protein
MSSLEPRIDLPKSGAMSALACLPSNFKYIWRLLKAFAGTFHVCSKHSIPYIYQKLQLEGVMYLRLCLYHSLKSKTCQSCTMSAFSALSKTPCTISLWVCFSASFHATINHKSPTQLSMFLWVLCHPVQKIQPIRHMSVFVFLYRHP